MKPDLSSIWAQPEWQLFHVDVVQQTFKLAYVEEQVYRDASFLDARALRPQQQLVDCRLDHLSSSFPEADTLVDAGFIFHIGHCGSTLLSRVLSAHESVLPLREPLPTLALSNLQRSLGAPTCWIDSVQMQAMQAAVLNSLRRPFSKNSFALVKLNSSCNNLILPILSARKEERALCIYLTLERYLSAMFLGGAQVYDVRSQAVDRVQDWMNIPGAEPLMLSQLSVLQMAAISWMSSMYYFLSGFESAQTRVRLLDFEKFLLDPEPTIGELSEHFQIQDNRIDFVSAYGSLARSYAKDPKREFNGEVKQRQLAQVKLNYAKEIASIIDWTQKIIEENDHLHALVKYLR